ncbi:MAG: hypothetical protein M1832_002945 [Thelocarpon impressellum]|nr:MAG: hypothetical protein M1832_002945 [Thelocarpon impressellum]
MAGRAKRRRVNGPDKTVVDPRVKIFKNPPLAPATQKDREDWMGFCEIESEPAFFNTMLRDFGVEGVKVQEVLGLDEQLLEMLPKPVYGLIFLFRWREDKPDDQVASCPPEVWFANQGKTSPNSCASVALLNIVNNVPGIVLGEPLTQFREFSEEFSPALRGDQICHFAFVKRVHNSFARKMDMLNVDLHLKNEATAPKRRAVKEVESDEEAGFHFIAYMPIAGAVWKLDGLERQPHLLGPLKDQDWVSVAKPFIEEKMGTYEEDQIQFGLFAVVQDPMVKLRPELARNVKRLQVLNSCLDKAKPDWTSVQASINVGTDDATLLGPDMSYGITQTDVDKAEGPTGVVEVTSNSPTAVSALMEMRRDLVTAQAQIRVGIKEEMANRLADQDQANARRRDYSPLLREWVRILAERGLLSESVKSRQQDD